MADNVNFGYDSPLARSNIDLSIAGYAHYKSLTGIMSARNAYMRPENDAKQTLKGNYVIDSCGLQKGAFKESTFMGQITEVGAYGDESPRAGQAMATHEMRAFVSEVDSELQPLPPELADMIIKNKVNNYPQEIKNRLIDFNANSTDISAIQAFLFGAGSELLNDTMGAKAITIGETTKFNVSNGIVGNPQMCRNFYVGDTSNPAFVPFVPNQQVYNQSVITATAGATFAAGSSIIDIIDDIIERMYTMSFTGVTVDGKKGSTGDKYFANALLEPSLLNRIKRELEERRKYNEIRVVLKDNPLFQSSLFVYRDILFIPHMQMTRFRLQQPSSSLASVAGLTFGQGLNAKRGVLEGNEAVITDPTYTLAPIIWAAGGAIKHTVKSGIRTVDVVSDDKKSASVYTRNQYGMNRGEYWARTPKGDASDCINKSSIVSVVSLN